MILAGVWSVVCGGLAAGWHQDTAAAGQVRNVSPATTRQSRAARQPGHIPVPSHTHTQLAVCVCHVCHDSVYIQISTVIKCLVNALHNKWKSDYYCL